jgi:hypothetical protein
MRSTEDGFSSIDRVGDEERERDYVDIVRAVGGAVVVTKRRIMYVTVVMTRWLASGAGSWRRSARARRTAMVKGLKGAACTNHGWLTDERENGTGTPRTGFSGSRPRRPRTGSSQFAGGTKSVNRELDAKARGLAGWKGYTTNLPNPEPEFVIGATTSCGASRSPSGCPSTACEPGRSITTSASPSRPT